MHHAFAYKRTSDHTGASSLHFPLVKSYVALMCFISNRANTIEADIAALSSVEGEALSQLDRALSQSAAFQAIRVDAPGLPVRNSNTHVAPERSDGFYIRFTNVTVCFDSQPLNCKTLGAARQHLVRILLHRCTHMFIHPIPPKRMY